MDADQLGTLHHLARGVDMSENGQAMDALREVGPGGHFLGCAHTQANFKDAFWRSDLLDYKPFETWDEEGARDTQALASARVDKMLGDYQQPALDPAVNEALADYVARRKASEPDAFRLIASCPSKTNAKGRPTGRPFWYCRGLLTRINPRRAPRSWASGSRAE